jgi:hypothetical protein
MVQLFARVELRGSPSSKDYDNLHAMMEKIHWYRTITGTRTTDLPHAMYQATADNPDVSAMAENLKKKIEKEVDFGNLAWPTSAVCFGPPCGTLMLRVFGSAGA